MRHYMILLVMLLVLAFSQRTSAAQPPEEKGLLIDWHPSGTMIAYTVYESNEVVIWDITSNTPLNQFTTLDAQRDRPRWSPDGELLAFRDSLNTISVWSSVWDANLTNREHYLNRVDKLGPTNPSLISGFAWHPSGTKIAHSVGPSLYIWDLASDEYSRISTDVEMFTVQDVEWFDENTLLFGDTSPAAVLINAETDQFEAIFMIKGTIQIASVSAISPSPNGTYVALASPFGQIEIWDPTQGEPNDSVGLESETAVRSAFASQVRISSLEWNPTGEYIAMADQQGLIRIWKAETLELVQEYQGLPDGSVAWSPDGTQLAFGTAANGLTIVDGPPVTPVNEPPSANAGPDQTLTDADSSGSESVILDGSASTDSDGTIVSYVWMLGGTEIATGATPTVDLPVGAHAITLTVTDNDGALAVDEVIITILEPTSALTPTPMPIRDYGWTLYSSKPSWEDDLEIFAMRLGEDGFPDQRIQLTDNDTDDTRPSWSPDYTRFSFASQRDPGEDLEIWMQDIATGRAKCVTFNDGEDLITDWSPVPINGTYKLAVTSRVPGPQTSIYLFDVGLTFEDPIGQPVQIISSSQNDGMPSWSLDGTEIAFHSSRDGDKDIWIYKVHGVYGNGSKVKNLINDNGQSDYYPEWSTDGSKIAFVSTRGNGDEEVYIITLTRRLDANGRMETISASAPSAITSNTSNENLMAWSPYPDDNRIVVMSNKNGPVSGQDLYLIEVVSGTTLNHNLTSDNLGPDAQPDW